MPLPWMCELAPTGVVGSDAFNHNQMLCREAFTYDRARRIQRAAGGRRALRVLIIDDDQDTTDGLVRLVRCWGHAVLGAYDGAAGLRIAAAQHPDVVLVDLAMPLMDGCQAARQLKRDFHAHSCFIIGVTGWTDFASRQQCTDAGIDLVLMKPADPFVLETLLMLECARVNRSQTDNLAGVASKRLPPFIHRKPLSEKQERSIRISRSGLAAGTESAQQAYSPS
jgi:CheY-like chemotaxis protein